MHFISKPDKNKTERKLSYLPSSWYGGVSILFLFFLFSGFSLKQPTYVLYDATQTLFESHTYTTKNIILSISTDITNTPSAHILVHIRTHKYNNNNN